jgi:predicted membrane GTPase involved in stress response
MSSMDRHQLHQAVVAGDISGIGGSSHMRQNQLLKTSDIVCVIVMIKVNEPDFCNNNLINDNPISDMDASITSKVLGKCFSNLRILQDFSDLFKSSFFQNGILFGQALKILIEKR